jgi:hypothetical protein
VIYQIEVWYQSGPIYRKADEKLYARTVEPTAWGLYLAHSDYEAYLSHDSFEKVIVTEVEDE